MRLTATVPRAPPLTGRDYILVMGGNWWDDVTTGLAYDLGESLDTSTTTMKIRYCQC